jgi:levoglucosan dehydrogenase
MVGLQYRRTPAAEMIRRRIEAGELGRVHTFRAHFYRDLGTVPAVRGSWRFDPSQPGAGSIVAMGPHALDLARFLVGEIEAVAATVTADVEPGKPVEDTADVLLRFAGGAHGVLQTSWAQIGYKHYLELEVAGTEGTARLRSDRLGQMELATSNASGDGFRVVHCDASERLGELFELVPGVAVGLGDATAAQLVDFVAAAAAGLQVEPDFQAALAVDRCVAAIKRSAAAGLWQTLDAGRTAR